MARERWIIWGCFALAGCRSEAPPTKAQASASVVAAASASAAAHDAKAKTATIEARFTAPDITRALALGARLPFAVYRMEGKAKRSYLAFSPPRTTKPNFHVPEAFATLVLDAN
jgi:hypothetical protein